jgi:cell division septal protein FtsQ
MSLFSSKKEASEPRRRTIRSEEAHKEPSGSGFRRNQTLRALPRSNDSSAASERHKAHHLTKRRRKIAAMLGVVLLIITLLVVLLSQFTARVVISGTSEPLSRPLESARYEQYINDYFGLHPVERLRFALNEQALSTYVASRSPEVARVTLSGAFQFIDSHFVLELRRPLAGWQINNARLFVDSKGVVFSANFFEDPSVQIIDQSGISPEQGTVVASTRLLSFVGVMVNRAGESGYQVTSVSLPSGTTRQLEVRLKDVVPFVRFTIEREAGEQVQDMSRTIQFLTEQSRNAEYIDVRVAGRSVYR